MSSSSLLLRVWQRWRNLSLRHLLVTARLGARAGGSGSEESTRKLRERSSAVVTEYQNTTAILPQPTPAPPSDQR